MAASLIEGLIPARAVDARLLWVPDRRGKWLCSLQEVQSNHFTDFLSPELQKHGYTAIYKKKTTEMYTGNKYAIDGCATFFRRDRFALVKKYEVGSACKKWHSALCKANSSKERPGIKDC